MDDRSSNSDNEVIDAILIDDDDDIHVEIDLTDEDISYDNVVPIFNKSSDDFDNDGFVSMEETIVVEDVQEENKNESVVVTSFVDRQKQKFKEKNYSRRQRIIGFVSVLVALVIVVSLILESPLLDVDTINLENNSQTELTQSELDSINAALQDFKGVPMYRVDIDKVHKTLSDLPEIENVDVQRNWPGTLTINFERRTPVAYINTDKGVVHLDASGNIFEKAEAQPQSIPVFEGIKEVSLYEQLEDKAFLEVLKATPEEIINQVVQVKMLENSAFEMRLSDGIVIKLGQPNNLERKLAIAWSIILAKDRSELGYIDVSVPTLPVSGPVGLQV